MLSVFGSVRVAEVFEGAERLEALRVQASQGGQDLLIEKGNYLYGRCTMLGYDLPNGNGDAIPSVYAGQFGPSFIGKHLDENHLTDPDHIIGTVMATWHQEAPLITKVDEPRVIGRNVFGRDLASSTRPSVFGLTANLNAGNTDLKELQMHGIFRVDRNTKRGDIVARKLLSGEMNSVSQEARTDYCYCSVCAHKVSMPFDTPCEHISSGIMARAYKVDGYEHEILAYKVHHNPVGTGLGVVTVPAYSPAKIAEVMAALKSGQMQPKEVLGLFEEQMQVWGETPLLLQASRHANLIAQDKAREAGRTQVAVDGLQAEKYVPKTGEEKAEAWAEHCESAAIKADEIVAEFLSSRAKGYVRAIGNVSSLYDTFGTDDVVFAAAGVGDLARVLPEWNSMEGCRTARTTKSGVEVAIVDSNDKVLLAVTLIPATAEDHASWLAEYEDPADREAAAKLTSPQAPPQDDAAVQALLQTIAGLGHQDTDDCEATVAKLTRLAYLEAQLNGEAVSTVRHVQAFAMAPEESAATLLLAKRVSHLVLAQRATDAAKDTVFAAIDPLYAKMSASRKALLTASADVEAAKSDKAAWEAQRGLGFGLYPLAPDFVVGMESIYGRCLAGMQVFAHFLVNARAKAADAKLPEVVVASRQAWGNYMKAYDACRAKGVKASATVKAAADVMVAATKDLESVTALTSAVDTLGVRNAVTAAFGSSYSSAGRLRVTDSAVDLCKGFLAAQTTDRALGVLAELAKQTAEMVPELNSIKAGGLPALRGLAEMSGLMQNCDGSMKSVVWAKFDAIRAEWLKAAEVAFEAARVKAWGPVVLAAQADEIGVPDLSALKKVLEGSKAVKGSRIADIQAWAKAFVASGGPYPWTSEDGQTWSAFVGSKTTPELEALLAEWKQRLETSADNAGPRMNLESNIKKLEAALEHRKLAQVTATLYRKPRLEDSYWMVQAADGKVLGRFVLGKLAGGDIHREVVLGDRRVKLSAHLVSDAYRQDILAHFAQAGIEATMKTLLSASKDPKEMSDDALADEEESLHEDLSDSHRVDHQRLSKRLQAIHDEIKRRHDQVFEACKALDVRATFEFKAGEDVPSDVRDAAAVVLSALKAAPGSVLTASQIGNQVVAQTEFFAGINAARLQVFADGSVIVAMKAEDGRYHNGIHAANAEEAVRAIKAGKTVTISAEKPLCLANQHRWLQMMAVGPKGWEGTIKEMKKTGKVENPWALAWYMKNKGYKSRIKGMLARLNPIEDVPAEATTVQAFAKTVRLQAFGPRVVAGMDERCPDCGIKVGPMPEDATADEMLCNKCYDKYFPPKDGSTPEDIVEASRKVKADRKTKYEILDKDGRVIAVTHADSPEDAIRIERSFHPKSTAVKAVPAEQGGTPKTHVDASRRWGRDRNGAVVKAGTRVRVDMHDYMGLESAPAVVASIRRDGSVVANYDGMIGDFGFGVHAADEIEVLDDAPSDDEDEEFFPGGRYIVWNTFEEMEAIPEGFPTPEAALAAAEAKLKSYEAQGGYATPYGMVPYKALSAVIGWEDIDDRALEDATFVVLDQRQEMPGGFIPRSGFKASPSSTWYRPDLKVEVVTNRATKREEFPSLEEARKKYPTLDPDHDTADFTWAMKGSEGYMRFDDWGTYEALSANLKADRTPVAEYGYNSPEESAVEEFWESNAEGQERVIKHIAENQLREDGSEVDAEMLQEYIDSNREMLTKKAKEDARQALAQDMAEMDWEDLVAEVSKLMAKFNTKSWHAEGKNLGWRQSSGYLDFKATDGREMLEAILPKTEVTIKVYDGGDSIDFTVSHHDAPTGEFYVVTPAKAGEADVEAAAGKCPHCEFKSEAPGEVSKHVSEKHADLDARKESRVEAAVNAQQCETQAEAEQMLRDAGVKWNSATRAQDEVVFRFNGRDVAVWSETKHILIRPVNAAEESPLLSEGNAKLAKSSLKTRHFSLPAWRSMKDKPGDQKGPCTCPFAGPCKEGCYAQEGQQALETAQRAYERNLARTHDIPKFIESMNAEIRNARTMQAVRIHDSGDFYSPEYLQAWLDIAKANPEKTFYAYTKSVGWAKKAQAEGRVPKNMVFVFSYGGTEDALIDPEKDRHAKVFRTAEDIAEAGYTDASFDDSLAATSPSNKLGIAFHIAKNVGKEGEKRAAGAFGLTPRTKEEEEKFQQDKAKFVEQAEKRKAEKKAEKKSAAMAPASIQAMTDMEVALSKYQNGEIDGDEFIILVQKYVRRDAAKWADLELVDDPDQQADILDTFIARNIIHTRASLQVIEDDVPVSCTQCGEVIPKGEQAHVIDAPGVPSGKVVYCQKCGNVAAAPAFNTWLDTFIEEKGIDLEEAFETESADGNWNLIPYGVVIEHMKIASPQEQAQIKNMLVKIDFANGDVRHFLRHLGKAIAASKMVAGREKTVKELLAEGWNLITSKVFKGSGERALYNSNTGEIRYLSPAQEDEVKAMGEEVKAAISEVPQRGDVVMVNYTGEDGGEPYKGKATIREKVGDQWQVRLMDGKEKGQDAYFEDSDITGIVKKDKKGGRRRTIEPVKWDEVREGDLIDFGQLGRLWVVNTEAGMKGDKFFVTDDQAELSKERPHGWYISRYEVKGRVVAGLQAKKGELAIPESKIRAEIRRLKAERASDLEGLSEAEIRQEAIDQLYLAHNFGEERFEVRADYIDTKIKHFIPLGKGVATVEGRKVPFSVYIPKRGYIPDVYVKFQMKKLKKDYDEEAGEYRDFELYDNDEFVGAVMAFLHGLGYEGRDFGRAELGMQGDTTVVLEPSQEFDAFAKSRGWVDMNVPKITPTEQDEVDSILDLVWESSEDGARNPEGIRGHVQYDKGFGSDLLYKALDLLKAKGLAEVTTDEDGTTHVQLTPEAIAEAPKAMERNIARRDAEKAAWAADEAADLKANLGAENTATAYRLDDREVMAEHELLADEAKVNQMAQEGGWQEWFVGAGVSMKAAAIAAVETAEDMGWDLSQVEDAIDAEIQTKYEDNADDVAEVRHRTGNDESYAYVVIFLKAGNTTQTEPVPTVAAAGNAGQITIRYTYEPSQGAASHGYQEMDFEAFASVKIGDKTYGAWEDGGELPLDQAPEAIRQGFAAMDAELSAKKWVAGGADGFFHARVDAKGLTREAQDKARESLIFALEAQVKKHFSDYNFAIDEA